jgi:hypothetical protein
MNTRKLPGVKDDQLTIFLENMGVSVSLNHCGPPLPVNRDSVTFTRRLCLLFGKSNDKKDLSIYI